MGGEKYKALTLDLQSFLWEVKLTLPNENCSNVEIKRCRNFYRKSQTLP